MGTDPASIDLTVRRKDAIALREAVRKDDFDTIKRLIRDGADINATDISGLTALIHASHSPATFGIMKWLLENGADVNANAGTWTALHAAALDGGRGHVEIVKVLLQHGADPNALTGSGKTASDYLMNEADGFEIRQLLKERQAKLAVEAEEKRQADIIAAIENALNLNSPLTVRKPLKILRRCP